MLMRITKRHKMAALMIGMGIGVLGNIVAGRIGTSAEMPTTVVEALPFDEWGFGTLPPGTAYYIGPHVSCITAFGQSRRLGLIRLVSNIHYVSLLSFPPQHTPPSAR